MPLPPIRASVPPSSASIVAQQRAADALRQRYGAAAAPQVHQLQAQSQAALALPGQQRFQGSPYSPPQHQAQQPQQPSQNQPQNPQNPQNPHNTVRNAQTDGAGDSLADWKVEVERRREDSKKHGAGSDHRLREYVTSRALLMEGGGLLAPLEERYPKGKSTKRKAAARFDELNLPTTSSSSIRGPSRYDGTDGTDDDGSKNDEEDEDAINSDLDDPEDPLDDDPDNDESVGQVMLCTYDKVQRVKSKWKCTLKDGILTSGGKE